MLWNSVWQPSAYNQVKNKICELKLLGCARFIFYTHTHGLYISTVGILSQSSALSFSFSLLKMWDFQFFHNYPFTYISPLFLMLRTSSALIKLNEAEAKFLLHMLHMVFLPDKVMLSLRNVSFSSQFHPCNLATRFSQIGFGFARVFYGAWHCESDD